MRALDRVVSILEAVADGGSPVTPTIVASRVGLSLSTVSRLMRQMADQGLLDRASDESVYRVGVRLLRIAEASLEPDDMVEAALPEMRHLRDVTRETVTLFVARGNMRICLAQIQSDQPIRRVVPVGFTAPLHAGATGEVLLAGLSRKERDRYLADLHMSSADLNALRGRLATIAETGYATTVKGWIEDVSAIAAGIRQDDAMVASLSVAGPSYRFTRRVIDQHTAEVTSAAERISRRIGTATVAAWPRRGLSA
jgi:DNA-binding IclR family transcriptional regulator